MALIVGAGAWVLTDSDPSSTATGPGGSVDEPEPEPEPPAAPTVEDDQVTDPPVDEPAEITIALEGVPEDAMITVDGEPAEGLFHTFVADGATHVFGVTAEGFEPFEATRTANADASIAVELVPIAETPRTVRPAMMVTRMMRAAMMRSSSDMQPPTVLDDLDY